MYFTLGWHLLASVQESNKGKSFQHTNLDRGFLGQGISGKIYIGNWRMKVFSDGQNVAADDKMFPKLTKQKLPEVESFFAQFLPVFQSFDSFSLRLVAGAKSHPAAAPWWIMKVIWKFEDKCPTFIICSGEGGGAWPELFFETPPSHPRSQESLRFLSFYLFRLSEVPREAPKCTKKGGFCFSSCAKIHKMEKVPKFWKGRWVFWDMILYWFRLH